MCCVLFLEQHPRLNLVTKLLRMLTSGQQLRLRGSLRKGLSIQASQRLAHLASDAHNPAFKSCEFANFGSRIEIKSWRVATDRHKDAS